MTIDTLSAFSARGRVCVPRLFCVLCWLLAAAPLQAAENEAVEVRAVIAENRPLVRELPLSGTVTSERVAQLSAQVQGLVSQVNVEVGEQVGAGDVLLELDSELRELELRQARAEADRARAEWEDTQRQLDEGERLGSEAIAASQVRTLEAAERISRAQWEAASAALARIEAELERFRIRAPFDGTLTDRLAELGEWITPGDTLFELLATTQLRLDFRVPQRYFAQVDEDTRASLHFDAYPGESFQGHVLRKVPFSQDGSRTFMLQVTLEEAGQPQVIPGMSVSGALQLDVGRSGLAVPRDAVLRYQDGRTTVWVLSEPRWGEASQVREQQVQLGDGYAGMVEVLGGLSSGDAVVTRGNEGLQEGQRVVPQQVDYDGGSVDGDSIDSGDIDGGS